MNRTRRVTTGAGLLAIVGAVASLAVVPLVSAADHLDAPTAKSDHRIDITDVFAFRSSGGTTLVLNVNPLTAPADTKSAHFSSSAIYQFNIDTNLDTWVDVVYRVKFGNTHTLADGAIAQDYYVKRATGASARINAFVGTTVAHGHTTAYHRAARVTSVTGGGRAFAGPRDDPFFFDLPGFMTFKSELLKGTTDIPTLTGGFTGTDTFAGTNVTSIVLEVPNAMLGGSGRTVGVWGTTLVLNSAGAYKQVDRMGRPAINTVFNNTSAEKEAANRLRPSDDVAFDRDNVIAVLNAIDNVLQTNALPNYTSAQIKGLANVLVPDELTVKLGSSAGFLNGRKLSDDVINAEFSVLTDGNITSDGVNANDRTFSASFPFLATPN